MRITIFKDRIFNIAMIGSFLWHILWLSAITVTVTQKKPKEIKFAKVAFLGPILERVALEVRIEPRERSFLERRLFRSIEELSIRDKGEDAYQGERSIKEANALEAWLINLIEDAVGASKLEPIYSER